MEGKSLPGKRHEDAEVAAALESQDLSVRAALELEFRHGRSLTEIAHLSGVDDRGLAGMRERGLDAVAEELGLRGPEARVEAARRLERALGTGTAPAELPPPAPEVEPHRPAASPSSPTADRRAPRWPLLAAAAILVVTAVVVIAAATGGDEDDPRVPVDSSRGDGNGSPTPAPVEAQLAPLPGTPGEGAARITVLPAPSGGGRVELRLDGLPDPDGEYRAWLFNSVIGSRALGSASSGSATIEAELPRNALDYEFLDVSIQSPGERAHSGESVFRAPLAELLGEGGSG